MMRFLLLLCGWFALGSFAAEPFRHAPSGFECPAEVAGFALSGVHDYEADHRGLGISCRYILQNELYADIYIFNNGLASVPADITHPVVVQLRDQTLKEIEKFAQSRGERTRVVDETVLKVETPRGAVSILYDALVITAPGGTRNTWLWLWTARNHFIKIRMTRPAAVTSGTRWMREFYEAVARLAAE